MTEDKGPKKFGRAMECVAKKKKMVIFCLNSFEIALI